MVVILYSVGCSQCDVLEEKLKNKNIEYKKIIDEEYMLKLGLDEMPVLEVNGERMNFVTANNWINEQ